MTTLSLQAEVTSAPTYRLALPGMQDYSELSNLISRIYRKNYDAEVTVAYPQLIGVYAENGSPRAALGMRGAGEEKLFLENYLAQPAEKAIRDHTGFIIPRNRIAEAGNLASTGMTALRNLMFALSVTLKQEGFEYILFTGTESLKHYLEILGMKPVVFARADPALLGEDAVRWGKYYDTKPQVMGGTVDDFYHGLLAGYCAGAK